MAPGAHAAGGLHPLDEGQVELIVGVEPLHSGQPVGEVAGRGPVGRSGRPPPEHHGLVGVVVDQLVEEFVGIDLVTGVDPVVDELVVGFVMMVALVVEPAVARVELVERELSPTGVELGQVAIIDLVVRAETDVGP